MMREITVESAIEEKLAALTGQTIVRDSQGRVLGFFSPVPGRPKPEELQLEPPLSIAEIEELRKNKTGKPLEEILARLGVK
jgi:hypothetical protein